MEKKSVKDIDVSGKRVLMRVDFNVPLGEDGSILDDRRIRAAIPTIGYLLDKGAKLILVSHLGRPKGFDPSLKMDNVAHRLSEILGKPVLKLDSCVGPEVKEAVEKMKPGDIIMLENVRFYEGETKNDPEFARQLAELADIYVNDAFGTAHRAHASTVGVANYLPAVAGFLMKKELEFLGKVISAPDKPFVVILGGAKVSDKIGVIDNLLDKADYLLIGGGMLFTFLKAKGLEIGKSLLDAEHLDYAKGVLEKAGDKIVLAEDVVVADKVAPDASYKTVPVDSIPPDWIGVDIGPKSVETFSKYIKEAKTIFWNGPMGIYEIEAFAEGTKGIAKAVAESNALSIVGGGDIAAALEELSYADKISHISTGGGASLEFIEGKELPGVAVLQDK
ncbi:MAG: phosphoglycerate kinase [bacterium]